MKKGVDTMTTNTTNIGPEKFTDIELESMSHSQLRQLHSTCRSWMDALTICPEFWEYSALSGRIEAIWNRQYEEYVRENRNPDGTWKDPR